MKNKQQELHIALAFDENYITPLYALLTSIFTNNVLNKIIIHAIATGLDKETKSKIVNYVEENNGEIYFYEIDNSYKIDELDTPYLKSTGWTVSMYYRLFFPLLLPNDIDKLLYIDTDVIVLCDLEVLYNIDISPFPVGAVPDIAMFRNDDPRLKDLGVEKQNYFNSGVLLIDLQVWTEQNIFEITFDYILASQPILKFPDQDALNHVLNNNYYKLDNKYNYTWDDIPIELPRSEIVKKDIVILHYTAIKPWKILNPNRLRSFYHYYLKKSPHKNQKKYTDFRWNYKLIKEFLKIRIIEFYLDHPVLRKLWNTVLK